MMDYQRPYVDAHTPWRVYVEPNLVSADGGMTWNELDIPGEDPSLVALEDVGRHGLIYANSGGKMKNCSSPRMGAFRGELWVCSVFLRCVSIRRWPD